MPRIELYTEIKADKKVVFDLSRSVELHAISTRHTGERAIVGKTTGLIGLNESVTWEARHFGIRQELTSKITTLVFPNYFIDEMVSGAFKKFRHEHHFTESDNSVLMKDVFDYESPLGYLGRVADYLFLKKYMTQLLEKRNLTIKEFAESKKWQKLLNEV